MAACLTPGGRLMHGVLRAVLMAKLRNAAAVVCLTAFVCTAGIVLDLRAGPAHDTQAPKTAPPAAQSVPPTDAVQIGSHLFRPAARLSRTFLADGGKTLVILGDGMFVQWLDVET